MCFEKKKSKTEMIRLRFQFMDDSDSTFSNNSRMMMSTTTTISYRNFKLSDTWRHVRDVLSRDVFCTNIALASASRRKCDVSLFNQSLSIYIYVVYVCNFGGCGSREGSDLYQTE
ncbi:hypothetical protein OAV88_02010 [bacterium]|nr:hypothetical protein [bacterium]